MHGLAFKAAAIILTFSLATSFANATDTHNTKMFKDKMGCMTCHQGSSSDTDEPSDNSDAT